MLNSPGQIHLVYSLFSCENKNGNKKNIPTGGPVGRATRKTSAYGVPGLRNLSRFFNISILEDIQ